MRTLARFEPFAVAGNLQEQINRAFSDVPGSRGEESNLTTWAPAVDIFETEHELVALRPTCPISIPKIWTSGLRTTS